jgi:Protein of unknown function (DUF541)
MRRLLLFLACCPAALSQLGSNVLTVTATRSLNLQPDQAALMVNVTTSVTTSLDDVLSALQPTKIAVASFSGVGTTFSGLSVSSPATGGPSETWTWTFTPTVPLAGLPAFLASLATVQQALSQAVNPMDLEFYVQGASLSSQLLASNPCPYAAVFSDAQTQAQKVAAAAGIALGPVVAMTDGYGTAIQGSYEEFAVASLISVTGALTAFVSPVAPAPPCTMVVQFKLGQ